MKFLVLSLVVFLLISCESEEKNENSDELIELFPSVDLKDYDTINFEDKLEFIIPYEYSISDKRNGFQVLSYSNLVDEVSVEFYQFLKKDIQRSLDSREVQVSRDSLLLFFADEVSLESTNKLKEFVDQEQYASKVNDLQTRYYRVTGLSHGYPFEQSISMRFYEDTNHFYAIYFKSLASDADELSDIEDAVMLSFKRL